MDIDQLAKKIAALIEQNRRLKADNRRYILERERFIRERQEQDNKIATLKERLYASELAGGFVLTEKGSAPARKKINKILREIDTLLALTSEQVDTKR